MVVTTSRTTERQWTYTLQYSYDKNKIIINLNGREHFGFHSDLFDHNGLVFVRDGAGLVKGICDVPKRRSFCSDIFQRTIGFPLIRHLETILVCFQRSQLLTPRRNPMTQNTIPVLIDANRLRRKLCWRHSQPLQTIPNITCTAINVAFTIPTRTV